MSPGRGKDSIFSRAVRETLDALVAPVVRDALIHDALILARMSNLPEEGTAIRSFATGALRTVTERALGIELARCVTEEILLVIRPREEGPDGKTPRIPLPRERRPSSPGFRRTSTPPVTARRTPRVPLQTDPAWPPGRGSHIRQNTPRCSDSEPPPPGMTPGTSSSRPPRSLADAPFVIVSTEDVALFETLGDWFRERARVCRVRSASALVRHLDGANGHRCIVILDGKSPSIRPAAAVVLLEDLPHAEVVLCRAAPATEQVVLAASPSTQKWLVYREPASLEHVAAECLRLVS